MCGRVFVIPQLNVQYIKVWRIIYYALDTDKLSVLGIETQALRMLSGEPDMRETEKERRRGRDREEPQLSWLALRLIDIV